jgi:hypothetical protein
LVEKHFPKDHRLHKIFNKNTINVSYSCTQNMANIIKSHKNRTLKRQSPLKPSKIENTWHMRKNKNLLIFSSDTLMCTQKRGGICFLKYYFKRRKLSKPDTYPRFAKLAKTILSHGLSQISFLPVGVS